MLPFSGGHPRAARKEPAHGKSVYVLRKQENEHERRCASCVYAAFGMRGEIVKAALLRMPITVFDEGLYLEVQKLVTQNNGDKKSVKLDRENFPMAFTEPESYLENAALFK